MFRCRFRYSVSEKVVDTASNVGIDPLLRQRRQLEMPTSIINLIGKIRSCVSQCSVQVKHEQIEGALHRGGFFL